MAKFNKGDTVYYRASDMEGVVLEIDEDDMDDSIYYYVSMPNGNYWINEWFLS